MADRFRILLGDDNREMLGVIRRMLENDFQVVAAVDEASAVVTEVTNLNPDVVLLDISMGEMNGFEITRQLRSRLCRSKIIFLTVHEEQDFINAAFDAGASGYVFKSRMNTDLPAAIDCVLNNKVFIPEEPIPQYGSSTNTV